MSAQLLVFSDWPIGPKNPLWRSTPQGDVSGAARVGSDALPAACPVPAGAGSAAREGVTSAVAVVSVIMAVGGVVIMDTTIAVV